ncbi:MAG: hypothetical protein RL175_998, partial [Pseudomonadota bacterium]
FLKLIVPLVYLACVYICLDMTT